MLLPSSGACLVTTLFAIIAAGMVTVLSVMLPRRFPDTAQQFVELPSREENAELLRGMHFLQQELRQARWEVGNLTLRESVAVAAAEEREADMAKELHDLRSELQSTQAQELETVQTELSGLRSELHSTQAQELETVQTELSGLRTLVAEVLSNSSDLRLIVTESLAQTRQQGASDAKFLRDALLTASHAQHEQVASILEEQLATLEAIRTRSSLARESHGEPTAGGVVGKGLWGLLSNSLSDDPTVRLASETTFTPQAENSLWDVLTSMNDDEVPNSTASNLTGK